MSVVKKKTGLQKGISKRAKQDFRSRLNRGLKILGMNQSEFLEITKSSELEKILIKLKRKKAFNSIISEGSKSNVISAFNRYISGVREYEKLMKQVKKNQGRYTKEIFDGKPLTLGAKSKVIRSLEKVFDKKATLKDIGLSNAAILHISDEAELKRLRLVSSKLNSGKFYEMMNLHFEETAQVIALKAILNSSPLSKIEITIV